jgi:hypothetical protein
VLGKVIIDFLYNHHEITVKCLSLKQPYAHLLASGKKTVELRKWNTKFRGHFLIHASLNTDNAACKRLNIKQEPLTKGGVIGKAYLYDVQYYETRREFQSDEIRHFAPTDFYDKDSRHGFLIRNAKQFTKPIPLVGKLRFFEVDL